ncbi:MAG: ZIP family metal transporter [Lautropia sp.]|nr:ZIP family metal transporter [Lautropia sp.]
MNTPCAVTAPIHRRSKRRPLGLLINVGGCAALLYFMVQTITSDPRIAQGFLASSIAGAATGLGAFVLPFVRRLQLPQIGRFMAFGGGMMLAAALVPLLTPAFAMSVRAWAWDVLLAMALGASTMSLLNRLLPHLHAAPQSDEGSLPVNALWLMVVAIAVHNLPEGFAVGAGFSGSDTMGWRTAVSIALQNIPEGLIVASALWSLKLPRAIAALGALLTGLVEPLGAVIGGVLAISSEAALPAALGFAGAAMIYIVMHELLPEANRLIHSRRQTAQIFVSTTVLVGLVMHWAD